jgi:hypothetical protein
MNSIILVLWITLPSGNYVAPATYYDSVEQCRLKVSQLQYTYTKIPVPVNWVCSEIIPEVEEF